MFNFKFLNKMTKNRFNLRKVATIVACLAVTTMFASCDGKNGDDDDNGNGGGKIDTKLVGKWEFMTNYYYFFKDGRFQYITSPNPTSSVYTGKFSTSNGKVYLSDIVSNPSRIYKDQNLGYSFGTDEQGEYLFIPQYEALSDVYGGDVSTWEPKKWRKDKTYVP